MVLEKIKELLADQLGIDPETITAETSITEDLGGDSLDMVELMMSIEDEYGVAIEDEKLAQIKTIGDVVKIIEEKK